MDAAQFRTAAHDAIDDILKLLEHDKNRPTLPPAKILQDDHGVLQEDLPTSGCSWLEIRGEIMGKIENRHTRWDSATNFAYFPANLSYESILGELYSAALNSPGFNWIASPALTEMDSMVTDWVSSSFGLPHSFSNTSEHGGGCTLGSATEGILVAMVAAKRRFQRISPGSEKTSTQSLVALCGEYTHVATEKVANMLGLRLVKLPSQSAGDYCIDGAAMMGELSRLRDQGVCPFFLTLTIGTTSTCAVDPLEYLPALKQMFPNVWVHIDAAYAGSALLCPEVRQQAKSEFLEYADSFGVNLHKWLFVNIEATCFFVTDRKACEAALSLPLPSFLRDPGISQSGRRQLQDWQVGFGRRFRALKVYSTYKSIGADALASKLRRHCKMAEYFYQLCTTEDALAHGIKVLVKPRFAVLVITLIRPCRSRGLAETFWDGIEKQLRHLQCEDQVIHLRHKREYDFTRAVLEQLNRSRQAFLTQVELNGRFAIRIVTANNSISEDHAGAVYKALIDIVEEQWTFADKLVEEYGDQ